ncbi:MAG: DUF4423 domain-containing protein [Bdellovibrionaceae bacterium]|nr:DUF4423 domain-containing protein [Pseudobdellovibrionaceae bacterium]
MNNYQKIKNDILNEILKKSKTSSLSHKLGYKFDKVKRWKNGTKQLNWNEFCDLCFVLKIPLLEALGFSLGALFENEKQAYKIIPYLKKFNKFKTTSQMAKQMGVSIASMQRYLSCQSYPEVEFILDCIDQRPLFLDQFLSALLVIREKSELTILSIPWASAVANAMSLQQHMSLPKFSPAWVAEHLSLTEVHVLQAVQLLEEIGLIEFHGNHYMPTLSRTIAVRSEICQEDYLQFIRFWMERASRRLKINNIQTNDHKIADKDGFRVFACSPNIARKITEVLINAEQEIHDLLQVDTEEKSEVRVFLYHHFSAKIK